MELSIPIYRKNETWYRTVTEVPHDVDVNGKIIDNPHFARYDECVYVEIPGYIVPLDLSLDQLVELHTKQKWGKTGSLGFRGNQYQFDTHIACGGHEAEVQERGRMYGFKVYCAV